MIDEIQYWIQQNPMLFILGLIIIFVLINGDILLWNEGFDGPGLKPTSLASSDLEFDPQGIKVWKKLKFKGEGVVSDAPIKGDNPPKKKEISPIETAVAQAIQSADPDLAGVQSNWIGQ